MDEGDLNKINQKGLDDLLEIFIEVYNLPKFSEYIKDTHLNPQERSEIIINMQNKLKKIQESLNDISFTLLDVNSLNASTYLKQVEKIKSILLSRISDLYPGTPVFLITNDVYIKLNNKHQDICEQLNLDLTQKLQEIQKEKAVKH